MHLDDEDRKRLIEALLSNGWVVDDAFIFAPRRTVWFRVTEPWHADLSDMLERMRGRLLRIEGRQPPADEQAEHQKVIDDTAELVSLLEQLARAR